MLFCFAAAALITAGDVDLWGIRAAGAFASWGFLYSGWMNAARRTVTIVFLTLVFPFWFLCLACVAAAAGPHAYRVLDAKGGVTLLIIDATAKAREIASRLDARFGICTSTRVPCGQHSFQVEAETERARRALTWFYRWTIAPDYESWKECINQLESCEHTLVFSDGMQIKVLAITPQGIEIESKNVSRFTMKDLDLSPYNMRKKCERRL